MQSNIKPSLLNDLNANARLLMVDGQIRPNRVTDPGLLDAMETTPRELFTATSHKAMAYLEGDCPVSPTRAMLAPTIFARMVDALQLTRESKVLIVGGMTGYSAAIISALAGQVTMIEPEATLAEAAESNFRQLNIRNVAVKTAPVDRPASETYTAIFVDGAIAQIPEALSTQLAENGRLVAIVGGSETVFGAVTLAIKLHGTLSRSVLFEAAAAFLPGMAPRKGFSF